MLEGLADTGADVPALAKRPDIFGLEWLWMGFRTLTSCRSFGMAEGPIPWTAIHTYTTAEGMTPFETRMLTSVVQEMDRIYLKWVAEKRKPKPQVGAPKTPHVARGRR